MEDTLVLLPTTLGGHENPAPAQTHGGDGRRTASLPLFCRKRNTLSRNGVINISSMSFYIFYRPSRRKGRNTETHLFLGFF